LQQFFKDISQIKGITCRENVPLAPLTTMKVGGKARCFITPSTIGALERVLRFLHRHQISFKVLGNGSNLIVEDEGVGVVLSLSLLKGIYRSKCDSVYVEAGCSLPGFLKWCIKNGYTGLESLVGIPGSLGGAISMNAGANDVSIGNFVKELCITTADGSYWLKADENTFHYRAGSIPPGGLVSAVRFRIRKEGEAQCVQKGIVAADALVPSHGSLVRDNIRQAMKKRLSTQPLGQASAGCIFKNPLPECSAWSLIASCGLQGFRMRDAQVSPKHANFIVNLGQASSHDVLSLIGLIKKRVWENTGVVLKEEVVVWRHEEEFWQK